MVDIFPNSSPLYHTDLTFNLNCCLFSGLCCFLKYQKITKKQWMFVVRYREMLWELHSSLSLLDLLCVPVTYFGHPFTIILFLFLFSWSNFPQMFTSNQQCRLNKLKLVFRTMAIKLMFSSSLSFKTHIGFWPPVTSVLNIRHLHCI